VIARLSRPYIDDVGRCAYRARLDVEPGEGGGSALSRQCVLELDPFTLARS
jgi:hypothetical protein